MYPSGVPAPQYCPAVAVRVVPVLLYFPPSRSSLIHLPSPSQQDPVDGKERQRRCQRKNNKNLTIDQVLPFAIPNLGPVARNGDGGETTGNRQRETKRRAGNTRIRQNLPLFIGCCFNVVVTSVSEVDREGTISRCYSF